MWIHKEFSYRADPELFLAEVQREIDAFRYLDPDDVEAHLLYKSSAVLVVTTPSPINEDPFTMVGIEYRTITDLTELELLRWMFTFGLNVTILARESETCVSCIYEQRGAISSWDDWQN